MSIRNNPMLAVLLLVIATVPACADKPADETAKADRVVGYVNEEPITLAEVEEKAAGGLNSMKQQRYDLLHQTLETIARERMLGKEAEARGITPEELLEAEVSAKVAEPTAKDIADFYNQNQARMGGRAVEEVAPRIKDHLLRQRTAELATAFEAQLKEKASFQLLLEPPRYEVRIPEGDPAMGPADAPVTIVEFADYQCPWCRRAHPDLSRVLMDYGDRVRFVYRDFAPETHPRAKPAAIAARCAGDQGKFWDYHGHLMTMNGDLSDDDLNKRAEQVGVNMEEFAACLGAGRHDAAIQAGFEDGQVLGVTGTPSFFINGRLLKGSLPYDQFKELIDKELALVESKKAEAGS